MSIRVARSELLTRVDLQIISVTLLAKLAVVGFGIVVVTLLGSRFPADVDGRAGDAPPLLAPWTRWDASHYLDIAVFGYRSTDAIDLVSPDGYHADAPAALSHFIVFFPMFPWLVSGADALIHSPSTAAFIVSGIALLFVGPLLYRLVAIEEGQVVARRSVWFLLLFPTAYFLYIGYPESLFLALVLASFLAARSDRWWLAGLFGALATATRVNGLILVPALAVEAILEWRQRPGFRPHWLAIGLIPLGFVAYLGLNASVYGDALAFMAIQRAEWHKTLSPPWVGIGDLLQSTRPFAWIPELAFVILGVIGTIVAALRFRLSWAVWMGGNLLLFTSTSVILSAPRYSIVLFPLFVWFALMAKSRPVGVVIGGLSALGLVVLAGRFALGMWAF